MHPYSSLLLGVPVFSMQLSDTKNTYYFSYLKIKVTIWFSRFRYKKKIQKIFRDLFQKGMKGSGLVSSTSDSSSSSDDDDIPTGKSFEQYAKESRFY